MTLLVPPELKLFPEAVAIDIAVNAVTPLHGAAVLTESGNINPQSKEKQNENFKFYFELYFKLIFYLFIYSF